MAYKLYLNTFHQAAAALDKKQLKKKKLELAVGHVLNSAFLKLYKNSWANPNEDPLTSKSRIFFSIWKNESIMREQKIFYNIHALKLRQLKGYKIQSRLFADIFRESFKGVDKNKWPNASVTFGPLTLMEGWLKIDPDNFKDEIVMLANNFTTIDHLIDNTLLHFLHGESSRTID